MGCLIRLALAIATMYITPWLAYTIFSDTNERIALIAVVYLVAIGYLLFGGKAWRCPRCGCGESYDYQGNVVPHVCSRTE